MIEMRILRNVTGSLLTTVCAAAMLAASRPALAALPAPEWQTFEAGFVKDTTVRHAGPFSLRCVNATTVEKRGGEMAYALNQTRATPVVVSGWSRARGVEGAPDADYAIYCDLVYDDGSHAYAYNSAFETGTHDWQRRRVIITPDRPIKLLQVYALLRGHAGTAWFADFAVTPLTGSGLFDSQPIAPAPLSARASSGWFVRDVAADSPLRPIAPGGAIINGLALSKVQSERQGTLLQASLKAVGGRNRAITLYYVERLRGAQPVWWRTIREHELLGETEAVNAVNAGDAGATGTHTKYPFGCVTAARVGRALAIPPDLGPRIARIGYHPASHLLYIAVDLALIPERGPAPVRIARYDVSPEWGMRDAARQYYALFPDYYARRNGTDGIWMPFTDPSKIDHVEDFGIGWHEGDNSVSADDRLGILSFRYAEPMSYWMPMAPDEKRDYRVALAKLRRIASGQEIPPREPEQSRRQAMATLTSGSRGPSGTLNVQFQNAPWCNGAVWTLNPNPRMPGPWNKARVNYDLAEADKRYGDTSKGGLDGEYLDSTEGWANVLDYGAVSLRASQAPPTFDTNAFRPVLPTWFSVWEFINWQRADLHRRKKLLMGNSTPWSIYAFASLLDAAGTETGWLGGDGSFRPESDAFMCWRRTLSGRKPYLLLLNTDFDRFTHAYVDLYFQRCLFYGIFPSFYSVNAADKPYWENAKWYERDRDLFKRYIPLIKQVSAAGWEPVTYARSDNPNVYLERYGNEYVTVLNAGESPITTTVTLDLAALAGARPVTVEDMPSADRLRSTPSATARIAADRRTAALMLALPPGSVHILHLQQRIVPVSASKAPMKTMRGVRKGSAS